MDLESRLGGDSGRILKDALEIAISAGCEAHHVFHAAIICRKFSFHRDHSWDTSTRSSSSMASGRSLPGARRCR
jgi:hypothetical protein